MAQRIPVLLANHYEDNELWYPYYRLREAGYETVRVAANPGQYVSKHGYPADAEAVASELGPDDCAGIVIPGGYAPDHLRRDSAVLELVRGIHEQGRLVAAICHGGWVLISAGIASNRRVTGAGAIRDDLVNAGAQWIESESVVIDNNLITSRHPGDLPDFGHAMVEWLAQHR